jgi:hypothetical protein
MCQSLHNYVILGSSFALIREYLKLGYWATPYLGTPKTTSGSAEMGHNSPHPCKGKTSVYTLWPAGAGLLSPRRQTGLQDGKGGLLLSSLSPSKVVLRGILAIAFLETSILLMLVCPSPAISEQVQRKRPMCWATLEIIALPPPRPAHTH